MLSLLLVTAAVSTAPVVVSLDDAIRIALSENVSVKIADKEIERTGYARKGAYAALFPQVDGSASFQRTIKKQVMYMDFAMPGGPSSSSGGGIEIGRWNTFSGGVSAALPLVNAQLWKSLKISGEDVELAVEKARGSRLDAVTSVKQAYYAALMAENVAEVYSDVYDNAKANYEQTLARYNASKASELDLARAKTTLANAIPNYYDSLNAIELALWQLKAVMGINLDTEIEIAGTLDEFSADMASFSAQDRSLSLEGNSSLEQLRIQAEQLSDMVKMQQFACLPSLAVSFAYNINAMTNDFNFADYHWSPYSFAGLSLSIPIFAGGKRHNAIRQAKVQASELELTRRETERQLGIALQQSLNSMETAVRTAEAAEDALAMAQKAYDIASTSYSIGGSTLTELNDAQLALTQASLSLTQAKYSFLVAKSNLEKIIGFDIEEQ